MLAYRILRRFLRLAVAVFFRQVEVAGVEHVPAEGEGPVIFAGNHPNSLLDPILILASCGRIVHFAAKDVLFRSRFLRFFLLRLGAVPVQRRSDHRDGAVDNQGAFDQLAEVLVEGRAMGIFPEGLSHDGPDLQRLKTGAARVALDVAARRGVHARIVPCGLNYVRRRRFRSRVLIQYGPPIAVDDELLARYAADEREAVRELTERIERGLRALTINAPDWETLRVLDAVRRLYQPPGISLEQRAELSRRFVEGWGRVKDDAEVAALYGRVRDYLGRLDAVGLADRDLRRQIRPLELTARAAQQLLVACAWLPLAAPGIGIHAPVVGLISWAGPRLTPRKDVIATTKLVLGLLAVPLVFATVVALVAWRRGPLGAVVAAGLLLLSGLATLRVLERGVRFGRLLVASGRMFAYRDEVEALRAERAALESAVVAAVERHLPPEMEPLFPRSAP